VTGLFWISAIPLKNVKVNFGKGTAEMHFSDVPVKDWTTVPNSLANGASVPATMSLHIEWSDTKRKVHAKNEAAGYRGFYLEDSVGVSCSTKQKGFEFVSDPAKTSTTLFAELGRERNGVFFDKDDEDDDDDGD
jgi:hypothetical protein